MPTPDTKTRPKYDNLPKSAVSSVRLSSRQESFSNKADIYMTPQFLKDFSRLKQQIQDLTALLDHQVES